MKKIKVRLPAFLLLLLLALSLFACADKPDGIWENAIYTEDTAIGEGEKTVTVKVEAGEKSITLTVKTDKDNLGDALFELGVINHNSFFDTVNGMTADWDKEQRYWAFYVSDKYASAGVAETVISGGESFKLVYSK